MHTSEVYAGELKKTLKEGDALWFPEPLAGGEVQIGDVGYMHEGAFIRLFNVVDPEKYPVPTATEPDILPEQFEPLNDRRAKRLDERPRALGPGPYKSKSVVTRTVEASASAPAVGAVSVGAGFEYECTKEKGALLILKSDAKMMQASSSKTFADYMAKHYDTWCKYASGLGIAAAEVKKITLVCGWFKTYPDWSVTAFTSNGSKFRASLDAKAAGGGGVAGSYSAEDYVEGPVITRCGIYARKPAPKRGPKPAQDQCIFVKCVYAKRRWSIPFLKAGAGPHQLPDQRDANSGQDGPAVEASSDQDQHDAELGDEMAGSENYGVMDAVLDYILECSNATIAVCSDQDIEDRLQGAEWPEDMKVYLRETRPTIEVNDDGTGSLSLEEAIQSRLRYEITSGAAADVGNSDILPRYNALASGEVLLAGRRGGSLEWPHMLFKEDSDSGSGSTMSISADGKYVATTCEDATILVWELQRGTAVRRLEGHTDTVWAVAFAPSSVHLVSGSGDATAKVWDIESSTAVVTLEGHETDVWAVVYSPDGTKIATGSTDCTVKVWDAFTGEQLHSFDEHSAHVMHIAFSPNGTFLASCADDKAFVWNPETGDKVSELQGHTGAIWCMRFSNGSDRIVTGSEDNTSRIWDVQTGEELVTLHEHTSPVWSVGFSPDDKEIVSGSYDCTIVTSDSFSGEQLLLFSDDTNPSAIDTVAYSTNGDLIASGSADGPIRLWDARVGDLLAEYRGHSDKVKGISFTPDNTVLVSSSEDGTVRAWSVRDVLRFF